MRCPVRDFYIFQIMSARIVLSCADGSAQFSERVLTLSDGGQVRVARAGGEDQPEEDNAVFDCKVWFLLYFYVAWLV